MNRTGDVIFSCILIAFTFPLMAIVAFAIKFDSPGPVLSRSEGFGLNGRRIEILKFRTTFHVRHSVSLTRVGSFLHFTRIEDVPQLFNVLRGELTLIGAERTSSISLL